MDDIETAPEVVEVAEATEIASEETVAEEIATEVVDAGWPPPEPTK